MVQCLILSDGTDDSCVDHGDMKIQNFLFKEAAILLMTHKIQV